MTAPVWRPYPFVAQGPRGLRVTPPSLSLFLFLFLSFTVLFSFSRLAHLPEILVLEGLRDRTTIVLQITPQLRYVIDPTRYHSMTLTT